MNNISIPSPSQKSKNIYLLILTGVAIALGVFIRYMPHIGGILFYASIFVVIVQIIRTKNKNDIAAKAGAFYAMIDVFTRMAKLPVFWEVGMYATILVLGIGLLFEKGKREKPVSIVIYILCLLPSILIMNFHSDFTNKISFNLGGPFLIAVSTYYFYNRKYTLQQFRQILLYALLAIILLLSNVIVFSNLSAADFAKLDSTTHASGGFGPNQVSDLLGLGVILLLLAKFLKIKLYNYKWIDLILLSLLLLRTVLTFSRGGVYNAVGFALFAFYFILKYSPIKLRIKYITRYLIPGAIGAAILFIAVNNFTNGSLLERYKGETYANTIVGSAAYENDRTKMFSGRLDIAQIDLEIFTLNPLIGVGPGEANQLRLKLGYVSAANAHTEYTRLLAEHGLYGLAALIILVFYLPIKKLRSIKDLNNGLVFALIAYSLLSMLHSDTRIASICFIYGLSFIIIQKEPNPLENAPKTLL